MLRGAYIKSDETESLWEQIPETLKNIDEIGSRVILESEVGYLTVVGGEVIGEEIDEIDEHLFVVEFFDDKGDFSTLLNPNGDPEEIISFGDGDFMGNVVVEFSAVEKAFEHFFRTGKLSPDLDWE
ncbi:hypothetical protein C8J48_0101 [Desmospora activa DSM 45169]|uniref:Uncharacterized protein n=1 Tax=Desmospora activa DSM 45169 TaxID=1121389 RepID=A0A2T4Z6N6_9BACL|nr:hypothetical protein C8J48_0101 [Desmospora activa DSM 45169]